MGTNLAASEKGMRCGKSTPTTRCSAAGTLGSNPSSTKDKYTDSHYALPISSAGLTALKEHFTSNNPYPITKDTRLAYACEQSYIIDPTGFCVQPIGRASWPNCGWDEAA